MVEIIPKPVEKLPRRQIFLLYFSLILFLATLISFFIINHSLKESQKVFQNLEETLAKERTPQKIILEKEILARQKKIRDFSQILNQHLFPSKIFDFLEKISHPQVWISQVNLNPQASQLLISGQTESFLTLDHQIKILNEEPLIKDLNLTQLNLTKIGKVEFTLNLSFDPKIFK